MNKNIKKHKKKYKNKNIVKHNNDDKLDSIKIVNTYSLTDIDLKIIKSIKNKINSSKFKNDYDFHHWKQKYSINFILAHILYVRKFHVGWRTLGTVYSNVYKHYIKLQSINIFKNTYVDLLKKYLIKNKNNTLKQVFTDTTFIVNKNGSDFLGKNKFMKNKNCNKISIITYNKFIPIDIEIFTGNIHDSKILKLQMGNILEYKEYIKEFYADKGYCSKETREMLKRNNIKAIIDYNNRNTKNKEKIKHFDKEEIKKYKKRIGIEHVFGIYKKYAKLGQRYERKIKNYEGLMYIFFIQRLLNL